MREDPQKKIALELLSLPPLIFRLIRRKMVITAGTDTPVDLKMPHFEIMRVLKEEGTLQPAKIGEKLIIAKAQMTYLIDRLVELGLVKRELGSEDRRTFDLTLTEKGHRLLEEQDNLVIHAVLENMSSLSDEELETLSSSLHKLRDILIKLQ